MKIKCKERISGKYGAFPHDLESSCMWFSQLSLLIRKINENYNI